jgi:hypothetical protein
VAADQVALQRGELVARDGDAAEVTETGSDAIDLTPFILDTFDDGARGTDARNGLSGEMYWRVRAGDSDNLV